MHRAAAHCGRRANRRGRAAANTLISGPATDLRRDNLAGHLVPRGSHNLLKGGDNLLGLGQAVVLRKDALGKGRGVACRLEEGAKRKGKGQRTGAPLRAAYQRSCASPPSTSCSPSWRARPLQRREGGKRRQRVSRHDTLKRRRARVCPPRVQRTSLLRAAQDGVLQKRRKGLVAVVPGLTRRVSRGGEGGGNMRPDTRENQTHARRWRR